MGIVIGSLAAFIPEVRDLHNLTNTILGFILIASIGGTLFGGPVVSYLINKIGSSRCLILGSFLFSTILPSISIKYSMWILIIELFFFGFSASWVDICMNTQAVLHEKVIGRFQLGFCHCAYAIGGLVGAFLSGILLSTELSLTVDCVIVGSVSFLPCSLFYLFLYSFVQEKGINEADPGMSENLLLQNDSNENVDNKLDYEIGRDESITAPRSSSLLVLLCMIGSLSYLGEGSVGDWGAIYLRDSLRASPFVSSLGFVAFQSAVAIARYNFTSILKIFTKRTLFISSGLFGASGLFLVSLSPYLLPSSETAAVALCLVGFGLAGAGLSGVTPLVITVAGGLQQRDLSSAEAVALVSTISYTGLLVGPPLIGVLCGLLGSLRLALLVDAALMGCLAAFSCLLPTL